MQHIGTIINKNGQTYELWMVDAGNGRMLYSLLKTGEIPNGSGYFSLEYILKMKGFK